MGEKKVFFALFWHHPQWFNVSPWLWGVKLYGLPIIRCWCASSTVLLLSKDKSSAVRPVMGRRTLNPLNLEMVCGITLSQPNDPCRGLWWFEGHQQSKDEKSFARLRRRQGRGRPEKLEKGAEVTSRYGSNPRASPLFPVVLLPHNWVEQAAQGEMMRWMREGEGHSCMLSHTPLMAQVQKPASKTGCHGPGIKIRMKYCC